MKYTLKELETLYCRNAFLRINRQVIINRNAIEEIIKNEVNGTIRICLKNSLTLDDEYLVVENNLTTFFENWVNNGLPDREK